MPKDFENNERLFDKEINNQEKTRRKEEETNKKITKLVNSTKTLNNANKSEIDKILKSSESSSNIINNSTFSTDNIGGISTNNDLKGNDNSIKVTPMGGVQTQQSTQIKSLLKMQANSISIQSKMAERQMNVLGAVNTNLSSINNFQRTVQSKYYETSLSIKKDILGELKGIKEILKIGFNIKETSKNKFETNKDASEKEGTMMDKLFGGGKGAFIKTIKEAATKSLVKTVSGGAYSDYLDMAEMLMPLLSSAKGQPLLKMGLGMGVKSLFKSQVGHRQGDDILSWFSDPQKMMQGLMNSKSMTSGNNKFLQNFFGQFTNMEENIAETADLKAYHKRKPTDRANFDVATHRSINEVIPYHLANIQNFMKSLVGNTLPALTKKDRKNGGPTDLQGRLQLIESQAQYYDPNTNTFMGINSMMDQNSGGSGRNTKKVLERYRFDSSYLEEIAENTSQIYKERLMAMSRSPLVVEQLREDIMRLSANLAQTKNSDAIIDELSDLIRHSKENDLIRWFESKGLFSHMERSVAQASARNLAGFMIAMKFNKGKEWKDMIEDIFQVEQIRKAYDKDLKEIEAHRGNVASFAAAATGRFDNHETRYLDLNLVVNEMQRNSSNRMDVQSFFDDKRQQEEIAKMVGHGYPQAIAFLTHANAMLERAIANNADEAVISGLQKTVDIAKKGVEKALKLAQKSSGFEDPLQAMTDKWTSNGGKMMRNQLQFTGNIMEDYKSFNAWMTEYASTASGKGNIQFAGSAAVGLGIYKSFKSMGMGGIMSPLAGVIGAGSLLISGKMKKIADLMGEEGEQIMENGKSRRQNAIENLIKDSLPASLGTVAGIKVSKFVKSHVRFGGILGPVLGAITGTALFAVAKSGLLKGMFKAVTFLPRMILKKVMGKEAYDSAAKWINDHTLGMLGMNEKAEDKVKWSEIFNFSKDTNIETPEQAAGMIMARLEEFRRIDRIWIQTHVWAFRGFDDDFVRIRSFGPDMHEVEGMSVYRPNREGDPDPNLRRLVSGVGGREIAYNGLWGGSIQTVNEHWNEQIRRVDSAIRSFRGDKAQKIENLREALQTIESELVPVMDKKQRQIENFMKLMAGRIKGTVSENSGYAMMNASTNAERERALTNISNGTTNVTTSDIVLNYISDNVEEVLTPAFQEFLSVTRVFEKIKEIGEEVITKYEEDRQRFNENNPDDEDDNGQSDDTNDNTSDNDNTGNNDIDNGNGPTAGSGPSVGGSRRTRLRRSNPTRSRNGDGPRMDQNSSELKQFKFGSGINMNEMGCAVLTATQLLSKMITDGREAPDIEDMMIEAEPFTVGKDGIDIRFFTHIAKKYGLKMIKVSRRLVGIKELQAQFKKYITDKKYHFIVLLDTTVYDSNRITRPSGHYVYMRKPGSGSTEVAELYDPLKPDQKVVSHLTVAKASYLLIFEEPESKGNNNVEVVNPTTGKDSTSSSSSSSIDKFNSSSSQPTPVGGRQYKKPSSSNKVDDILNVRIVGGHLDSLTAVGGIDADLFRDTLKHNAFSSTGDARKIMNDALKNAEKNPALKKEDLNQEADEVEEAKQLTTMEKMLGFMGIGKKKDGEKSGLMKLLGGLGGMLAGAGPVLLGIVKALIAGGGMALITGFMTDHLYKFMNPLNKDSQGIAGDTFDAMKEGKNPIDAFSQSFGSKKNKSAVDGRGRTLMKFGIAKGVSPVLKAAGRKELAQKILSGNADDAAKAFADAMKKILLDQKTYNKMPKWSQFIIKKWDDFSRAISTIIEKAGPILKKAASKVPKNKLLKKAGSFVRQISAFIPYVDIIIAVAFTIWDGVKGYKMAKEVFGHKDDTEPTAWQRAAGAIGGVLMSIIESASFKMPQLGWALAGAQLLFNDVLTRLLVYGLYNYFFIKFEDSEWKEKYEAMKKEANMLKLNGETIPDTNVEAGIPSSGPTQQNIPQAPQATGNTKTPTVSVAGGTVTQGRGSSGFYGRGSEEAEVHAGGEYGGMSFGNGGRISKTTSGLVFISQEEFMKTNRLGGESLTFNGCSIACMKMVNEHLKLGYRDSQLIEIARKYLTRNNAVDTNYFTQFGGFMTQSPMDVRMALSQKDGAVVLLINKNGSNHFVTVINKRGRIFVGDPENADFVEVGLNDPLFDTFIVGVLFGGNAVPLSIGSMMEGRGPVKSAGFKDGQSKIVRGSSERGQFRKMGKAHGPNVIVVNNGQQQEQQAPAGEPVDTSGVNLSQGWDHVLNAIAYGEKNVRSWKDPTIVGRADGDTHGAKAIGITGLQSSGSFKDFWQKYANKFGLGHTLGTNYGSKDFTDILRNLGNTRTEEFANAQAEYLQNNYLPQILGKKLPEFMKNQFHPSVANSLGVATYLADAAVQNGGLAAVGAAKSGEYRGLADPRSVLDAMYNTEKAKMRETYKNAFKQGVASTNGIVNRFNKRRSYGEVALNESIAGMGSLLDKYGLKNGGSKPTVIAPPSQIKVTSNKSTSSPAKGAASINQVAQAQGAYAGGQGGGKTPKWITVAMGEVGQYEGSKYGAGNASWCMAFVSWCFRTAGYNVPFTIASQAPKTSSDWVKIDTPRVGCVNVYENPSDPSKGHVDFYLGPGDNGKAFKVIGGNSTTNGGKMPKAGVGIINKDKDYSWNKNGVKQTRRFVGHYVPKVAMNDLGGASVSSAGVNGDAGETSNTAGTIASMAGGFAQVMKDAGATAMQAFAKGLYAILMGKQPGADNAPTGPTEQGTGGASGPGGAMTQAGSDSACPGGKDLVPGLPVKDGQSVSKDSFGYKLAEAILNNKYGNMKTEPRNNTGQHTGLCATAVNMALGIATGKGYEYWRGNANTYYGGRWGHESDGAKINKLKELGYELISVASKPQVGDIIAMTDPRAKVPGTKHPTKPGKTVGYGHVVVFCGSMAKGSGWVSDYQQLSGAWPYSSMRDQLPNQAFTLWRYTKDKTAQTSTQKFTGSSKNTGMKVKGGTMLDAGSAITSPTIEQLNARGRKKDEIARQVSSSSSASRGIVSHHSGSETGSRRSGFNHHGSDTDIKLLTEAINKLTMSHEESKEIHRAILATNKGQLNVMGDIASNTGLLPESISRIASLTGNKEQDEKFKKLQQTLDGWTNNLLKDYKINPVPEKV